MELNLGLQLKMAQKMIMSPRMIQSLKLLQMQRLELQQLLRQELNINPLLEELALEQEETDEKASDDKADSNDVEADRDEQNWDDYLNDAYEPYTHELSRDSGGDEYYEPVQIVRKTLHDKLREQLVIEFKDANSINIGEEIIGEISPDGYLTVTCKEIAERLNIPVAKIEEVLRVIQSFDPAGVGACDLRESLLIQLRRLDLDDVLAYEIVDRCFSELEKRLIVDIAKKLKISIKGRGLEEIQQALDMIATLDPKPGLNVTATSPRYIIPDLFMTQIGENFVITVNESDIPRLKINHQYAKLLLDDSQKSDKTTKEFISTKLNSAKWLIKSIDQRRRTMIRVMEAILKRQQEFFQHGIELLKPMTLREIADDIGVHESTVSRVTSNKYVQTNRGVFELKYFFGSKVETESGEDTSATSVMQIIKEIIENEDPQKPYSDSKIVELLAAQGVKLARRTVAKYRDTIKILPARYRKRI